MCSNKDELVKLNENTNPIGWGCTVHQPQLLSFQNMATEEGGH